MKFSQIISAIALISTAVAAPQGWGNWGQCSDDCITQATATDIVNKFITILNHYDIPAANATAQALLADNFAEISDSILSLEGQPVSIFLFNIQHR